MRTAADEDTRIAPSWTRLAVTAAVLAALAAGWSWRERGAMRAELDALHHPPAAVLVVRDLTATGTVTLVREATLLQPPEHSWSRSLAPGRELRLEVPAGVLEITDETGTRSPVLMMPGQEVVVDRRPAPTGFSRVDAGPFLGELSSVVRRPRRPGGEAPRPDGYLASRTEVTIGEYRAFLVALGEAAGGPEGRPIGVATGPAPFTPFCSPEERTAFPDGCPGHRPSSGGADVWRSQDVVKLHGTAVHYVSWFDAAAYASWLTATAARSPVPLVHRLPSHDEWQKAARGVDGRPFPWGFDPGNPAQRVLDGGFLPVDSRPDLASPFGLFNTATGVAEWTATPEGATRRIVMGRTWDLHTDQVHLGYGVGEEPTFRGPRVGFRLVADEVRR